MTAIRIDRTNYELSQSRVSGADIRNLLVPRRDGDYDLFLIGRTGSVDRKVEPHDEVDVVEGMAFFTAPRLINNSQPTGPMTDTTDLVELVAKASWEAYGEKMSGVPWDSEALRLRGGKFLAKAERARAEAVLAALEPVFIERERAATREVLESLHRWVNWRIDTLEILKNDPGRSGNEKFSIGAHEDTRREIERRLTKLNAAIMSETKPPIVCLCGSGRFREAFEQAEFDETLSGKIVLTIGCNTKDIARDVDWSHVKPMLDELHLRKIDMADEVFIVNVDGYIGESTARELAYAQSLSKQIRYLCPIAPAEGDTDE